MKIALCLSGYFVGKSGLEAAKKGYDYIFENILEGEQVDIFIHSWDVKYEREIRTLFKPIDAVIEPQYDFKKELNQLDEDWFKKDLKPGDLWRPLLPSLSMNYSRMKSVEYKKKYEDLEEFKYDLVIIGRFDMGQRGKEHPQLYYVTNINFKPQLDMNYIYTAFWNQMNCGFAEHWVYSNSENIDKVADLYNHLLDYYQTDSEYVKAMTEGWPYSNSLNEFSNEIFKKKENRTTNFRKYPRWECINNHAIYKWHFLKTGLINKCRFLEVGK
jgi:hypothetical protein